MLEVRVIELVLKYVWPRQGSILCSHSGALKGSSLSEQVSVKADPAQGLSDLLEVGAIAVISRCSCSTTHKYLAGGETTKLTSPVPCGRRKKILEHCPLEVKN